MSFPREQIRVHISDTTLQTAISSFIVNKKLCKLPKTLKIINGDHKQEDGTYLIKCIGYGSYTFKYLNEKITYTTKQIGEPLFTDFF